MATWLDELKVGDKIAVKIVLWERSGSMVFARDKAEQYITPDMARAILKILEAADATN